MYKNTPDSEDPNLAGIIPEGELVFDDKEQLQKTPSVAKNSDAGILRMMNKFAEGLMTTVEGEKKNVPNDVEVLTKEFNAQVNTLDALDRAEKRFNKGDMNAFEFIKWANKIYDSYKMLGVYWDEKVFGDDVPHTEINLAYIKTEDEFKALTTQAEKENLVAALKIELMNVFRETRRELEAQKEATEKQLKLKVIDAARDKISEETTLWANPSLRRLVTTEALRSIDDSLTAWPGKLTTLETKINTGTFVPLSDLLAIEDKINELYTSRREELLSRSKDITLESVQAKSEKLKEESQSAESKKLIEQAQKQAAKILEDLVEGERRLDKAFHDEKIEKGDYNKQKDDIAEAKVAVGKYVNNEFVLEGLKAQGEKMEKGFKKTKDALDKKLADGEISQADYDVELDKFNKNLALARAKHQNEIVKARKYKNLESYVDLIWSDTDTFPRLEDGREFPRGIDAQIAFAQTLEPPFREQYIENINYALDQYKNELGVEGLTNVVNKELSVYAKQIKDFVREFEPKKGEGSTYTWNWLSYRSGEQFVEKIKEWAVRRYERNNDRKVGEVGERITKNVKVPYTETLSTEFNTLIHHAEGEEVHKYEGALEHLQNPYAVFNTLRTTRNSDEFRAAIQVLCKGGDMRWDDDGFLEQVNYFQHAVRFRRSAYEASKPAEFHKKLQLAFSALYHSPQLFVEWEKQNESAYTSSKSGFNDKYNKMAESIGMNAYIKSMLVDFVKTKEHGHEPEVDAHEYEGAIEYCTKQGKMSPQARMYYLIQGMACGLLAPERGKVLDAQLLNEMPALELFNRESGLTMADIMSIAALDKDKFEPGIQFKTFFTSEILHNQSVYERVQKALSGSRAGMDHDDFAAYSGLLETKEMLNLMKRGASGFTLPKTAMPNATVGFLDYIDIMAHTYHKVPRKESQLARYVNTVLLYNNISNGNMYQNDKEGYFRYGANEAEDTVPRAAGSVMRGGAVDKWSARKFLDEAMDMISPLDKDGVFDFINKKGAHGPDEVKAFVARVKTRYNNQPIFGEPDPADYDALVNAAGNYIAFMIKKNPGDVDAMFTRIRTRQAEVGKEKNVKAVGEIAGIKAARAKEATKARFLAGFPPLPGEEDEFDKLEAERLADLQPGHHGHGHHGHGHHDHDEDEEGGGHH